MKTMIKKIKKIIVHHQIKEITVQDTIATLSTNLLINCPYRALVSEAIAPAAMRRAGMYCPFRAKD
jgi:hypothetical protein